MAGGIAASLSAAAGNASFSMVRLADRAFSLLERRIVRLQIY